MNGCSPIPVLLLLLFAAQHATAQALPPEKVKKPTYDYDFVQGENTVFFDDFEGEKVGIFPAGWELLRPNHSGPVNDTPIGSIAMLDNVQCLYFTYGNGRFAQPHWDTSGYTQKYKNNYWSVEFDFKFVIVKDNAENGIGIEMWARNNKYEIITCSIWSAQGYKEKCSMSALYERDTLYKTERAEYPVQFNNSIWHHFAVAITNRGTYGYVDHCKFLSLPALGYYLPNLVLRGRARVAIKNFRLARTDSAHRKSREAETRIATLLTEKKFTTHAITFDKNKADIRPESMRFINELAGFLKANPTIKLEIDGHTDSDGTAAANMTLSNSRAEAIKRQLVSMGIAPGRLTTKGFGASTPIETNATPEGMAQNRRVEFVKQ